MKVIHFAGFSNSGKTTFISSLLPELEKLGPVAVVKHIGHHGYSLAEGKDTSRFFEAGAKASVGIDAYKSVMILQENQLESILEMLCDSGAQYAVVEGFKETSREQVTSYWRILRLKTSWHTSVSSRISSLLRDFQRRSRRVVFLG
jgi:molybdopterin-guanine dinucleotide biosynthesis protein MobB